RDHRREVRLLEAAAARTGLDLALTPYPIGWKAYEDRHSTLTPERVAVRNHMGWILGPTFAGEYPKDDPIKGHPSGYLRRNFALFANVRPVRAWPQLAPLIGDLDITILREHTEGFIRTATSPGAILYRRICDRGNRRPRCGIKKIPVMLAPRRSI